MNAGFNRHYSPQVLEEYAMGIRSEKDSASLEEHLLICATCQTLLAEADQYIHVMKAAAMAARTPGGLSKSVATTTELALISTGTFLAPC
jgi:hypothetical protein